VNNIRMDLGEVGWGDVDWIGLAQDRNRWRVLLNSVLNFRVPYNTGKLSSGLTTGGLSSSAQLHGVSYYMFRPAWPSPCVRTSVVRELLCSLGNISCAVRTFNLLIQTLVSMLYFPYKCTCISRR
jgi:hypothetical protein